MRIDRGVNWISITSIALLVVAAMGTRLEFFELPAWLETRLLPVLTAAAIGYLTNRIAIWMLFKPYRPISILGLRIQGVIPRRKPQLGAALGEQIPQYLLDPDEISRELGSLITETLHDPALLADLRAKSNAILARYSSEIAAFLMPPIEQAVRAGVRDNLTPQNLRVFYDKLILQWLGVPEHRELLAGVIIAKWQERAPEFAQLIRDQIRLGSAEYMREQYPRLCMMVPADQFAMRLADSLNWDRIELQIRRKLKEPAARQALADELSGAAIHFQNYLKTPDAERRIREFLDTGIASLEELLHDYLKTHLPRLADSLFQHEQLWDMVENQLLPLLNSYVEHWLREKGRDAIIAKLNLGGRIERSVAALDIAELHRMIDRISGEHLCAIQLLGYLLGGAAGFLLLLL